MKIIPGWHFWNPRSGAIGGLIFGALIVFIAWILIALAA